MTATARTTIKPVSRPVAVGDKTTPSQLNTFTKLGVIVARFIADRKNFNLEDAINAYGALKPEKSSVDALYRKCCDLFKETGLPTIHGRFYRIDLVTSERVCFDKEAFIHDHGQEAYDKYCKPVTVREYNVSPQTVVEKKRRRA